MNPNHPAYDYWIILQPSPPRIQAALEDTISLLDQFADDEYRLDPVVMTALRRGLVSGGCDAPLDQLLERCERRMRNEHARLAYRRLLGQYRDEKTDYLTVMLSVISYHFQAMLGDSN